MKRYRYTPKVLMLFFLLFGGQVMAQVSPAQNCAECHKQIFAEWISSRHANSTRETNPLFARMYNWARSTDGQSASDCLTCHEPIRDVGTDENQPELVGEGVSCDICHATELAKGADSWRTPAPQNLKYGPLEDALTSVHQSEYAPELSKSEFCLRCHSNAENSHGVAFCSTEEEWKRSSFAKKGVQCQDCHMPGIEGKASPLGKLRDTIHSHAFYGGYSIEMLRNSASIDLRAESDSSNINLSAIVINRSVGHALPTGSPMRMVILKIEARDAEENVRWQNYQDNPIREDPSAVLMRLLQNEAGVAPVPPWEATSEQFDQRLMPDESREFVYQIPAEGISTVEATLIYRLAPPPLLKKLGLDRAPWIEPKIINRKRIKLQPGF